VDFPFEAGATDAEKEKATVGQRGGSFFSARICQRYVVVYRRLGEGITGTNHRGVHC
jgi:hypothetical protein